MKDAPRILIDASNLVAGGGIQVGASVVDQVLRMQREPEALDRWPWLRQTRIEASPAVIRNASSPDVAGSVHEVPSRSPRRRLRRRPGHYDVTFAVFGPVYDAPRSRVSIVGFADGTSLHPGLAAIGTRKQAATLWLRSRLSLRIFAQADVIVVEAAHSASALQEKWGIDGARIRVIPNVLNGVFFDERLQTPIRIPPCDGALFAYPTRAYPHKNLSILGPAAASYAARHAGQVRYVLTLTQDEWRQLSRATRESSVNVGPIEVAQVPSLLRQCRGTIFPSLLESFSVTPLEALAVRSPLVATDRDFVRTVVGDCAVYFDPMDPHSVADALGHVSTDRMATAARVEKGADMMRTWPGAVERTSRYLELIDDAVR